MGTDIPHTNRLQNSPNHDQDYLSHRDSSTDHNFITDHRIAKPRRQKVHLHYDLAHARAQLPRRWLEQDLCRPKLGFVGRIVRRISGFSEFSSSPDSGLPCSGIIHSTDLLLLQFRVTVLELTRGPISQNSWSKWWSDFGWIWGFGL